MATTPGTTTSRFSSRSSGQDSTDQCEVDMKIVKKVLTGLSQIIVDIIQHDISSVLDSARGKSFIGEGLYGKLRENYSNKEVAREFLDSAMSRFMLDSSEFEEFLKLFDEKPSLTIVSKRIREEIENEMAANQDCVSQMLSANEEGEFGSRMFQGSYPSLQDRSLEEDDMVSRPSIGNIIAVCESVTSTVQTLPSSRGVHEDREQGKQVVGGGVTVKDQTASSSSSTMPLSYYDQAQRLITSEKNEARSFVHSIDSFPLNQMKEDLEYSSFAPNYESEVQNASKNYQSYMTNVEKKEVEMEAIRKKYEKESKELEAKHKESMKDKDKTKEQEKQELIDEYEQKLKASMKELKKQKEQASISDTTFKLQTMDLTIKYKDQVSKLKDEKFELKEEMSKLKDEISKLKDEISKQKDEISRLTDKLNQNMLDEKDRIIRDLQEQLLKNADQAQEKVLTANRSVETGEHS